MQITEIPFEGADIHDPTTIRAIIEIGRGERPGPFSPPEFAGGYGAIIWGRGHHGIKIWGAGYARADDTLRGYAVRDILEHQRNGARLIVHSKGLRDQLGYVSRSQGRTADGRDFDGYEVLKPIQEARERGEWELVTFRRRGEPEGHHLARGLAEAALKTAEVLRPLFSSFAIDHPFNHIIATSEDPDPDGIVSRLKGGA